MPRNDATLTHHSDSRFPLRLARIASVSHLLAVSAATLISLVVIGDACAGEADLAIPDLHAGHFDSLGGISAWNLLFFGSFVIVGTLGISIYQLYQIQKQPAHQSMLDIAEIIFQTRERNGRRVVIGSGFNFRGPYF